MFISSDNRERHAYYELAVNQLRNGLADPSVQASLGEFASFASLILADIVPANQKHGVVTLPRKQQNSNAVPLVIVRPGGDLVTDKTFASNNGIQVRRMRTQIRGLGPKGGDAMVVSDLADIARFWQDGDDQQVHKIPEYRGPDSSQLRAFTYRRPLYLDCERADYLNLGAESRRVIFSRSLIAMVLNNADPYPAPSRYLIHEIVHVADSEMSPLLPYVAAKLKDLFLRFELRGYHAEAGYCIGLYNSQTSPFAGNDELLLSDHSIEMLRAKMLRGRRDQFEPLGALRAAIESKGIDYQVNLSVRNETD